MPDTLPFEFRRIEQILAARLLTSAALSNVTIVTSFNSPSFRELRPRIELTLSVDAPLRLFHLGENLPIAGGWQIPLAWTGTLMVDVVSDVNMDVHEALCAAVRLALATLSNPLEEETSLWVIDEIWPTSETPAWNSEENNLVTTITCAVKWRIRRETLENGG